ncbi:hypothetical protein ACLB2K_027680 [Fragaria x ananassa]
MIEKKFRQAGYGDTILQLVFWNLRHFRSIPVPGNQKGTALLSGFSKNLLKLFMDNDGEVQPDKFMDLAIAGPEYQKLWRRASECGHIRNSYSCVRLSFCVEECKESGFFLG